MHVLLNFPEKINNNNNKRENFLMKKTYKIISNSNVPVI